MKRDMILKLAASGMVMTTVLTGCGPFGGGSVASVSSKPATVKDGARYAKKAKKALAKGQVRSAIAYAERSVAGVGTDPETRALLGQAYMAAGRFSSAERSFMDAMELGKNDARTVLSLSLAQLAQGKADKAKRVVVENRQYIPAADYGLALALSGDSKAAVDVLERAIRDDRATGRTRQNLGLAYALDGRWKEAKLMAVQDMTPTTVNSRMMQWAQMARPGAYQTRVASLLNVTPAASDPGQPVALALNAAPSAMPAVAAVTPVEDYKREVSSFDRSKPLPAVGPSVRGNADADFMAKENDVKVKPVAIPASKPAKIASVKVPKPVAAAPAPIIKAAKQPARVAPSVAPKDKFIVETKTAPKPKPAPVRTAASSAISALQPVMQKVAFTPKARAISGEKHLVQLGAFSSAEGAKRAWGILTAQNKDLAAFQYASSKINVKGKTLYRLAAMGFGNAVTARDMCTGIKAKGGSCIVRHIGGNKRVSPTRMASKKPKKLAVR